MKRERFYRRAASSSIGSWASAARVVWFALLATFPLQNRLAWAASCPLPSFAASVVYNVGENLSSVAVGDFNGDGKPDLVLANPVRNSVSLLLGNGDGTFQNASNYSAGTNPVSVAVGDFNGDGKPDLAVADFGSGPSFTNGGVSVLLGNGNATFRAPIVYPAGIYPAFVAVGDFSGDGKLDLAVANSGSTNISVLLGNGDGTFQTASNYSVGKEPYSVAVGDFNGDGKLDLAVANSGSTNISVLLGNGDGTFRPAVNYGVKSYYPQSVAVGDFDGDGNLDLAVVNAGGGGFGMWSTNNLSVLLGNGDGTFKPAATYNLGASSWSVAVGDFNGDGKPDLAVAIGGAISVLLGNGDGTFRVPVTFEAGAGISVAVGDFNGDGKPDLGVANNSIDLVGGHGVAVLLNNSPCAGVHLNAVRNDTTLTLSWPLTYANFILEVTPSFGSPNWQGVVEAMTTNSSGCCEITVPLGQPQRLFRLRKP